MHTPDPRLFNPNRELIVTHAEYQALLTKAREERQGEDVPVVEQVITRLKDEAKRSGRLLTYRANHESYGSTSVEAVGDSMTRINPSPLLLTMECDRVVIDCGYKYRVVKSSLPNEQHKIGTTWYATHVD